MSVVNKFMSFNDPTLWQIELWFFLLNSGKNIFKNEVSNLPLWIYLFRW
jgi:hypothetical protein